MKSIPETAIVSASIVAAALTLMYEPALRAQTGGKRVFATATVTRREGFPLAELTSDARRFTATAAPLIKLIEYAYDTSMPAIVGKVPVEPSYDIDATSAVSATPSEMREMLKNLLADRFALRTHTESRRMPFFRLVVDAGGQKLQEAKPQGVTGARGRPLAPGNFAIYQEPDGNEWRFVAASVTVSQIAHVLADSLGAPLPVVDVTGIKGTFDVDVVRPVDRGALPEAVAHELGLKLEAVTSNIDVLVIDGFKMP